VCRSLTLHCSDSTGLGNPEKDLPKPKIWRIVRCHRMSANKIVQIKTVQGGSPEQPTFAVLTNMEINDSATADVCLREVAKTFISHRMCSPPQTNGMLFTIIGDLSATRCVELWRQIMSEDKALLFFMSQMRVADVIRGSTSGDELEKVSIIEGYTFPDSLLKLRNDPFVVDGPSKEQMPGVMARFRKLFGRR
jgi:hypothetical protein